MTTEVKPQEATSLEVEEARENVPGKHAVALEDVDRMLVNQERAPEARGHTLDNIPSSYWYSWRFLGTFLAIVLAKDAGSGGFSLAAPVLAGINKDIGPDPDITWVSLAWTLTQGVSALIVGRLSDIFGRRWIFIIACVLGTIGTIWASQASTVKQLIGATVLLGFAGGVQISFFWILSEIVPMKYRFFANAIIYVCSFTSYLGPKISYDFYTQTSVSWRGSYYLLIALNGLSTILWILFYHPPTFKMLHRSQAMRKLLVTFDWVGLVLYTASFVALLMGLNWGGSKYPWKSVHVLASLLCGIGGLVIFILWEYWLPRRSKNVIPFVPLHFFTNVPLLSITGMTAIASSSYYGLGSVFPGLVRNVFPKLSQSATGDMLSLPALSYILAQAVGGFIAHGTGPKKPLIITIFIATPILACAAIDPFNMAQTAALVAVGVFFVGAMEGVALTATTFPLKSQEEIGSAGGVTSNIRLFISTIATAIYNTTINNRLNTTIPGNVGPAAIAAGLPASSVEALIKTLRGGLTLDSTTVPGLNGAIEAAARLAYRHAYAQAYQTLFLVCIAFTAPGCILCWFCASTDRTKEDFVAGHIHKVGEEKKLEREEN